MLRSRAGDFPVGASEVSALRMLLEHGRADAETLGPRPGPPDDHGGPGRRRVTAATAGHRSTLRTWCADAARDREDPPLGTAPPTRRWLLIEHPGPWPIDAVAGAGFPAGCARRVGHRGQGRSGPHPAHPPARAWALGQRDRAWAVSVGWPAPPGAVGARRRICARPLRRWLARPPTSSRVPIHCCWSAPTAYTTPAARSAAARSRPLWPGGGRKRPGSAAMSVVTGSPPTSSFCRTASTTGIWTPPRRCRSSMITWPAG